MASTPERFEMCFVGDRSESMASMGNAPWKGVRDWANDQAAEAQKNNHETNISLITFLEYCEPKCKVRGAAVSTLAC